MTKKQLLQSHLRGLADRRCKRKHRDYYDSLICVGPGSGKGFGPPCDECIAEVEREQRVKRRKARKKGVGLGK